MDKLVEGLKTFMTTVYKQEKDLFDSLAEAQNPNVLFITCSDSRVDPNLITQTKPGELFVIRNAGNIVPPDGGPIGGEAATIEYGIEALGVPDIIVCGHSDCGAVKAALSPETAEGLPAVSKWLQHIEPTRRIVGELFADRPDDVRILGAVEINVLVQIDHLRSLPVVRKAIEAGKLHLHGWVFHIDRGEVHAYDPQENRFARLTEAHPLGGTDWPL